MAIFYKRKSVRRGAGFQWRLVSPMQPLEEDYYLVQLCTIINRGSDYSSQAISNMQITNSPGPSGAVRSSMEPPS
jgi:hypothetical protein